MVRYECIYLIILSNLDISTYDKESPSPIVDFEDVVHVNKNKILRYEFQHNQSNACKYKGRECHFRLAK